MSLSRLASGGGDVYGASERTVVDDQERRQEGGGMSADEEDTDMETAACSACLFACFPPSPLENFIFKECGLLTTAVGTE